MEALMNEQTDHKMKVGVDLIKVELLQDLWSRLKEATKLRANTWNIKIRKYKHSHRRHSVIIGIDENDPSPPVSENMT